MHVKDKLKGKVFAIEYISIGIEYIVFGIGE